MRTANRAYFEVLRRALSDAGRRMRRCLGKTGYRYKGRANLVTRVDHENQKQIMKKILGRFPGHNFMGEEDVENRKTGDSEFTWVVDPVDGTCNFAHGYPVACVSIALVRANRPLLGGIYDPFRDELFLAEEGRGATLNGRTIQASTVPRLKESLLVTGFPYDRTTRGKFYTNLYCKFMLRSHDIRRSGSAALDMAWVACGRADGFWEYLLNPWDVAAGLLIVQEAGGKVSDFKGKAWSDLESFGRETLATNGKIHRAMLKNFSPAKNQY